MVARVMHEGGNGLHCPFELVNAGDTGQCGEPEPSGMLRQLEPINTSQDLLRGVGDLLRAWPCTLQFIDNGLDNDSFRVLKAFKCPAVEPNTADALISVEQFLSHLQDAGFTRPPVAVHTNSDRGSPRFIKQALYRFGDRGVIQQVSGCFLVIQEHAKNSFSSI
ncbi:diguanylate cyclase or its enzymatically inactive variants [Pseudomonas syringae pv. actinidiae]|uniref:Diguanylate cyclase or its enzymatically inactive variants n=1 Tax=Pseudomonas syringae pv. actinidiae TaxID=103796 RepID=A0AAN4TQ06_PSESF|nr:diguanylate cyclase or its enzymatically inactive variants [Pseudomonas syringae pv. actinidiae]